MVVRAAKGAGIVTSLVLQSLDLDEIDWEWVGNDVAQVQTNYFSKGCDAVFDRGTYAAVANPQDEFHTYTINWTPEKLEWIVNGAVVRTLNKAGLSGCSGYPQTPMQIKLGTWVGGRADKPNGTIEWSGGLADFKPGHPNYVGYYQKVSIVDYMGGDGTPGSGASEATEYEWTDNSGDSDSIKIIGGDGKGGNGGGKTTTSSSSTKSSTKTSSSTTLQTVTSSSASGTASPSGDAESSGSSDSGSPGPSKTGGDAPAQSSNVPSGSEKLALPLGMGLVALIAALL